MKPNDLLQIIGDFLLSNTWPAAFTKAAISFTVVYWTHFFLAPMFQFPPRRKLPPRR